MNPRNTKAKVFHKPIIYSILFSFHVFVYFVVLPMPISPIWQWVERRNILSFCQFYYSVPNFHILLLPVRMARCVLHNVDQTSNRFECSFLCVYPCVVFFVCLFLLFLLFFSFFDCFLRGVL
jgi:hypothetical protein